MAIRIGWVGWNLVNKPIPALFVKFFATKLDIVVSSGDTDGMEMLKQTSHPVETIARQVRLRIEQGGEKVWRLDDFRDQPFPAVAQALSRLFKAGIIQRLSKGVYYRPKQTIFGQSRPNHAHLRRLAQQRQGMFPAGIMAANMLGFTTQAGRRGEVTTSAGSLPRKLIGADMVVHTRRPAVWADLSETDAALLDFMRRGGRESELSPEETTQRLLMLLAKDDQLDRLLNVAASEPPRMRALLGALAEQLKASPALTQELRHSLNPLSRFDFGLFAGLPNAKAWQAKEPKSYVSF
jgi:hypothetical protein